MRKNGKGVCVCVWGGSHLKDERKGGSLYLYLACYVKRTICRQIVAEGCLFTLGLCLNREEFLIKQASKETACQGNNFIDIAGKKFSIKTVD